MFKLAVIATVLLAGSAMGKPTNCLLFCDTPGMSSGYVQQPISSGYVQQPISSGYVQQPISTGYVQQPIGVRYVQPVRPARQHIFPSTGLGLTGGRLEDFGHVQAPAYQPSVSQSVIQQGPQDAAEAMYYHSASSSNSNSATSYGYVRQPVSRTTVVQSEPIRRYPCANEYVDPCVV